MDPNDVALSIIMAFGLFLLGVAWITSGEFSVSNVLQDRSTLGENPDEHILRLSLGPVIFVTIVASIVWMMYSIGGSKRFARINALARSAYRRVLHKAAAEGDGQNGMSNSESLDIPKEDKELEEILRTIRLLKKEALKGESLSSENTLWQSPA